MATAQRIVSLISSATEILYRLGLGDRVVGVSHECDYPSEVLGKPRLTRSLVDSSVTSQSIDDQVRTLAGSQSALYVIEVERLAALEPDVIVTQAQCDVCAVRYEDVAAAVRDTPALAQARLVALNPRSIADVLDDVRRIAEAVGGDDVAAQANMVRAGLTARLAAVEGLGAAAAAVNRPRVILLEWVDPPMVASNWMPELVTMAGGEAGLAERGAHSGYARWQDIVDYDPQVLVIVPCGFDVERAVVEAQVLAGWPGWSGLTAVREGRVFAADGNAYFNRSGPRLVDSAELLGHLFHSDHFPPPGAEAAHAWRRLETRDATLVPSA
jgi:iron complex transport system substrate-binding protein